MPYVPVQRDAGRIMYESAMQRAQSMGQTARNITDFLYQKDEENKAFGAKLKSLETLLQTHSDKFGMDEDQLKQFLSVDPNESPKERYLRVGGFIEGTMKASELEKEKLARQEMEVRTRSMGAQAAEIGSRQRAQDLQNAAMEQALQMRGISLPQGAGAGGPSQAAPAAPSRPAPAAPRPSIYELYGRAGQPAVSEEERAYLLSQQPTSPAETAAQFAPPPSGGGQKFPTPPGLDPKVWQAAMGETLYAMGSGKGPSDPMVTYNRMLSAQKTARVEEIAAKEQMSFDDANAKSKQLNEEDPNFLHYPKVNPNGSYGIEKTPRPKSSEALGREAAMTKLSEERAKDAVVQLGKYRSAGATARDNLSRYDRMEAALNAGVATGFGADTLNTLTSLAVSAGLYPEGKKATQSVLFKDLAVDAFEKARLYLEGQGSVSQAERDAIKALSMSAQDNPKALLQLIAINRQLALRQIAADDHRMALMEEYKGDPLREIGVNEQMQAWFAKNPLGKFETAARMPSAGRSTADDIFNEVMGRKK